MSQVGAVVIGRNEGVRLQRCLETLLPQVDRIVYVDSGSSDDSVTLACSLKVPVVVLGPEAPFTAARGRNAGFDALLRSADDLDYVQFVDGDCGVETGWIEAARASLDADPSIGLVTGWRTEIEPGRNIYHAMSEVEWHRPSGDIASCGGDMMVRVEAFRAAGGFNPRIIASEDEEFCLRLTERTGLRAFRIPRIMTHHDINMTRIGEWWRRHVRAGHGYSEIGTMYPDHFRRERLRAWVYALSLPALAVLGASTGHWWLVSVVAVAFAANLARTTHNLQKQGIVWRDALSQAAFLLLSKVPNLQGMLTYHIRRMRQADFVLIEYK